LVGQPKPVGFTIRGIAAAAMLGDFEKSELDHLPQRRRDAVAPHPILAEIAVGDQKVTVRARTAVRRHLNFNPVEQATR
jgi:hypothetical protein